MKDADTNLTIPGEWNIRYEYAAGETASRFLLALKDEASIYGVSCPKCGIVFVPPRAYCERCFVPTREWIKVGPDGNIEAFTIVPEKFDGLPDPPYAIAYVTLDGAGTAMANFIEGIDLSDVRSAADKLTVGTRVRAVFRPRREARVTDFVWNLA